MGGQQPGLPTGERLPTSFLNLNKCKHKLTSLILRVRYARGFVKNGGFYPKHPALLISPRFNTGRLESLNSFALQIRMPYPRSLGILVAVLYNRAPDARLGRPSCGPTAACLRML